MAISTQRSLFLLLVLGASILYAYAEEGEQHVVSPTNTSDTSDNSTSSVISDGDGNETSTTLPIASGGSNSTGQNSSEQTESETVSGGFLGGIGIPEKCTDPVEKLGACFGRQYSIQNLDCLPCLSSDIMAPMQADPPQLPDSCEEVSDIMCHLASCCEPCNPFGRGGINCFNIEGGSSPDGQRCEINCDTSANTFNSRDSGATNLRSQGVAMVAAVVFSLSWIVV
uniref:Uncharacterized protein n=1 Tax=Odontella aurita TaxID=265563 RepID=A0A7S4N2S4_9STRA|mmetsp:Transcript_44674/g.136272  ORF Transcript_44674/g.136272 Transcript_44674/m.136272 type:complete len:226 (+) Transcript_44674:201-878(+)